MLAETHNRQVTLSMLDCCEDFYMDNVYQLETTMFYALQPTQQVFMTSQELGTEQVAWSSILGSYVPTVSGKHYLVFIC